MGGVGLHQEAATAKIAAQTPIDSEPKRVGRQAKRCALGEAWDSQKATSHQTAGQKATGEKALQKLKHNKQVDEWTSGLEDDGQVDLWTSGLVDKPISRQAESRHDEPRALKTGAGQLREELEGH